MRLTAHCPHTDLRYHKTVHACTATGCRHIPTQAFAAQTQPRSQRMYFSISKWYGSSARRVSSRLLPYPVTSGLISRGVGCQDLGCMAAWDGCPADKAAKKVSTMEIRRVFSGRGATSSCRAPCQSSGRRPIPIHRWPLAFALTEPPQVPSPSLSTRENGKPGSAVLLLLVTKKL